MDENITPLAKKLAEENSIDWRFIRGTGPSGKVIERDILSYLARIMSGELDLPAMPDASEPAGPAAGSPNLPDMGQVANFDVMSASMAKEGVDLNSMLTDFNPSAQAAAPAVPEYDFSMPAVSTPEISTPEISTPEISTPQPIPDFDYPMPSSSSVNDDVVLSSQVSAIQAETPSLAAKAPEADDAVFEFDLDDIDEVEPVPVSPDSVPAINVAPLSTPSFDEDQIMTVSDDQVAAPNDEVSLSTNHDEISVHVSGEFEPVPDPLENVAFELDAENQLEPVQTLIVEDAILEPELVVDDVIAPAVHVEPAGVSFEGLAAVGAGALGIGAAFASHAPVSDDLELELDAPVVAPVLTHVEPEPVEPVVAPVTIEPVVEPEPVVAREPVVEPEPEPEPAVAPVVEPMIAHFDPEPEPVDVQPAVVHAEPEAVVALEPQPVHVPAEPAPIVIPAATNTVQEPSSQPVPVAGSSVHKDFFNTNILRRQFNASALMEIQAQISKALNGRDVQLGVFVGRAAQRGLYLLGTTDAVTLNKLEAGLVPLSTAGLHHSFIEAVQSVNHADAGTANGLAVLDASSLGIDDLVLPASGALLALGQISNNMGTLTLSGDFPAKAGAEFLAHVAGLLETPVGLVL